MDQYASFRPKLPASSFTVAAIAGGQIPASGTLHFYIQLVNRAGRNLLSDPNQVTYTTGQKIVVTINQSAIATGEEVFYILISASPDTEQNAKQLARWQARETNQTTLRALPITIELTEYEHLIPNGVVSDLNSLPSGEDLINGMVREVQSETGAFIYDEELDEWLPYPQGASTYISDTTSTYGSDRPLNVAGGALRITLPNGGDSSPLRLWWLNGYTETGATLPRGKKFNLRVAVDKSLIASNGMSYSDVFSSLIKVSSPGYVRRSTGVLDTVPNQPQFLWSGSYTALTLPVNLPPGYAIAWDIVLSFSDVQMPYLKAGSSIEIDLVEVPNAGLPSPLHAIYGDTVLNKPDYFYIVPNRRLKGSALLGGYQASSDTEQIIVGLLSDTARQKIAINGALNGEVFVREPIVPLEALRAIVSTEAGIGRTTAPSGVTLTTQGAISVTVTHPTSVRADYPDVVARIECPFSAPYIRVFVVTSSGILRRNDPVSAGTDSTTILISELSNFTPIQTIVSNSGDFGLFEPTSVVASAIATGSIAAGTYQIIVAYEYPSPNYIITKVSHSPNDGCIVVQTEPTYYWRSPIATVAIAKSLSLTELIDGSVRLIREKKKLYFYDALNEDIGDNDNIIEVNHGEGAFVALGGASQIDNNTYLTDERENILTTESGDNLIWLT